MRSEFLVSLLLLSVAPVLAAGCASAEAEDADAATDDLQQLGGVSGEIQHDLLVRHPSEQNKTWTITQGNAIPDDGILQMPVASTWRSASLAAPKGCSASGHCNHDFDLASCSSNAECGGGKCAALAAAGGESLCVGHSDTVLDEIYGVMTSAEARLDVTSLSPPTGRFMAAMRNAVTALDKTGKPIVVRFLFGQFPHSDFDTQQVLADLTRDVRGTRLSVSVGKHRKSPTSWNHSKIIAVDGKEAIVGGMNLLEDHYLDADPVHDASLHVKGPVATTMQKFANDLWQVACSNQVSTLRHGSACPPAFVPQAVPAAGNVQMIGIGREGTSRDATMTALVSMMDTARRSIHITQQDIGSIKLPGGVLVNDYVDAWLRAARRGVDIEIILSNDGAHGGLGDGDVNSYSNGWSREELWRWINNRQEEIWPNDHAAVCKHLHISTLRGAHQTTWADGRPMAQHAKVVIVDDLAYYIGSQNLYDANLAEYGVIVDNRAATQKFAQEYFAQAAANSTRVPFVDASCR